MNRRTLIFLAAILVLGAVLRFYALPRQSLWDDEISTIDYTAQTPGEMWRDLPGRDANPPLFYVLFHYWRELGRSEAAYRTFPALLGVLSLLLAFLVFRRLVPAPVALLGVLLLAVNPLSIYCAQETRAHTLLLCASLLSFLFYIRLMECGRVRDAAGWALATAATMYTHYYAVFVVAAQMAHAAWTLGATFRARGTAAGSLVRLTSVALNTRSAAVRTGATILGAAVVETAWTAWRRLLLLAVGAVAAVVLYLPWVPGLALQLVKGQGWRPYQPPWSVLAEAVIYAFVGAAPTRWPGFLAPMEGMQDGGVADRIRFAAILLTLLVPFVASFVAGLLAMRDDGYQGRVLTTLWTLVPMGLLVVVTQAVHLFDVRHLLPFVPPMALAMAVALDRLRRRSFAAFAVLGGYLVILPALSLAQYYGDPAFAKQDWRGAYRRIAKDARPGDAILSYHEKKALGLVYYSDGRIPFYYVVPREGFTEATV
jgi:hypothetical protein